MKNPNIKLNIDNLVKQLLPWYKRQPVRLAILRAMVSPLRLMWADFDRWRDDTRMTINVNSQVAVLEGYLKKKYNQPVTITIVTFDDGALEVGLIEEGETFAINVPLENETELQQAPVVPLDGEIRAQFGDVDFIVYIPIELDVDLVTADIERFKQALIKYKIVSR